MFAPMFRSFTVSVLTAAALFGATAEARSIKAFEVVDLEVVSLDAQLNLDPASVVAEVNHAKGTLKVTFTGKIPCTPDGLICAAVMPVVTTFEAPIIDTYGSCGSVVYVAEKDQRPVDGELTRITVQDNRKRMCRDLRAPTEVELVTEGYDRLAHKAYSTLSTFEGDVLR